MSKHHEEAESQGTAVLTAIHDAEAQAQELLEQARWRYDETVGKARTAATLWEQKELEAARTEVQAWLDAELKAAERAVKPHSAEADKAHAGAEKRLDAAVAVISKAFDEFLAESTEKKRR